MGLDAGRRVRDHPGSYPIGGKGSVLEDEMIKQICQHKRRAATNMLPHLLHYAPDDNTEDHHNLVLETGYHTVV